MDSLFIFIIVTVFFLFLLRNTNSKVKKLEEAVKKLQAGLSGDVGVAEVSLMPKVGKKTKVSKTDSEEIWPQAKTDKKKKQKSEDGFFGEYLSNKKHANIAAKNISSEKGNSKKSKKIKNNLEETIGSLWAVWVGGIALAFGVIFLVKYSIDQGLLSPAIRIALGLAFSAVLVALGEWTRQKKTSFSFANFEQANIPAILTAVGTMGAFASIYAAYQLYDMMPDMVAFIALAIVAMLTIVAALLHGPLLAVLGIVASFIMPFLISSDSPSIIGLGMYVIAVSVAGFAVGRLRLWRWLALISAIGLIVYAVILHALAQEIDRIALASYVIISFGMIAYVFVISLYKKSTSEIVKLDIIANVLLSILLAVLFINILMHQSDNFSVVLMVIMIVGAFILAYFYSTIRAIVYSAGVLVFLSYIGWSLPIENVDYFSAYALNSLSLSDFQIEDKLSIFSWVGGIVAFVAAAIGLYGTLFSTSRVALAIGGSFVPLLIFAAAYIRLETFSLSYGFSVLAFVMFAVFLSLSEFVYKKLGAEIKGRDGASASYIIAAFIALAFALDILFERGMLTVSLALIVPIIAIVNLRRPLPALRVLAVLAAVLWIARIVWDPRIVSLDLGVTPIFNWLLYGYGVPTAGFILGAYLLAKSKRDIWVEALEAIALASFVATLALVGLHAINPLEVFTQVDTLVETALFAIIGGGISLGLLRFSAAKNSKALKQGGVILGFLGMLIAASGLFILSNPWVTRDSFGNHLIFNELLYAYLATGILYLALGWFSRGKRPAIYCKIAMILGALLLAFWVNLTIRHGFHSLGLTRGVTSEAELYTYSLVWLLISVAMLAAGIFYNKRILRKISVGLLVLVVAKVFLYDMAGLEGVLRALSFIGLGATLVGIGLVYQKILSKGQVAEEAQEEE